MNDRARLPVREFGQKLRFLRRYCELTQAELTQYLGFSTQAHISNLEKGRKEPSLLTVIKVATLFQVTIDYLLRDEIPVEVTISRNSLNSQQSRWRYWCGERLRSLRIQRGLSQSELRRRLSLTAQSYLSNLELGRQEPSISILLRLADELAVSIEDFLVDEDHQRSDCVATSPE